MLHSQKFVRQSSDSLWAVVKIELVSLADQKAFQCFILANRFHKLCKHLKNSKEVKSILPSLQKYTYRVFQTIQVKLTLLCVWAERAVLVSAKTTLKFKYEIQIGYTNTIQCMWHKAVKEITHDLNHDLTFYCIHNQLCTLQMFCLLKLQTNVCKPSPQTSCSSFIKLNL